MLLQNGTSDTTIPYSGNPGYIVKQPVRAGVLTTNSAGVSYPFYFYLQYLRIMMMMMMIIARQLFIWCHIVAGVTTGAYKSRCGR